MFKKGEYIVYGVTGVCRVEEIAPVEIYGISRDRLYYTLTPMNAKDGKIFTPVDNEKVMMRPVATKKEAEKLINSIPDIEELWVQNEKMREMEYKEAMRSCDCREYVKIIKTLYIRKMDRIAQGKKITATDERYLKMAEDALYSELSIPLKVPKEQMVEYISEKISKK